MTYTPTPTKPLPEAKVQSIFDKAFAAEIKRIEDDKAKRRLKNQKANRKDLDKAKAAGWSAVLKAQTKERYRLKDPKDPLTDDALWNPNHPLYARVNELVCGKAKMTEDAARAQAQAELDGGVIEAHEEPKDEDLEDLAAWLEKQTWSEFALDVAKFYRKNGYLSPKQVKAAKSMRTKVEARQAKRDAEAAKPQAEGLDVSTIPAGRYGIPNGDTRLKIKVEHGKDGSRWAGWSFVKDAAEYGQQQRYGIQKPNETYRGKVEDELRIIAADPKAAMAEYGRLTGTCGKCGRPLEDEASVAAGIGPICAQSF